MLATRAFVSTFDFLDRKPKFHVDDRDLDTASTPKAFVNVVNAQLDKLGVSHLELLTPAEHEQYTQGRDVGAGFVAQRETKNGVTGLRIQEVFAGGAADKAGLRTWDLVTAVDGKPLTKSANMSGPAGTRRSVTFVRGKRVRTAELVFTDYSPYRPAMLKWVRPDVALISIGTFTTSDYHAQLIDSLFTKAAGAKAIILDLRYNRGGALANVFDLLGHLLDNNTVVSRMIDRETIARSGREFKTTAEAYEALKKDPASEVRLESDHTPYRGKLVVLTSHLAGSGGDRFPGTLKDLGRATLVGYTTMGKLLHGDWATLTRDYQLLYPSGEVLMPSGFRIEGVGVEPDVKLSQRDVLNDKKVTAAALKVISKTR